MSSFYQSSSAGGQLSLLQDMATDHCGRNSAVLGGGLRAAVPQTEHAVERHAGSLSGGQFGFPPNFLSSYAGADFRDLCPPTAATKVSPTGAAIAPRRCYSDKGKDDFVGGLDVTAMEMRDVFKRSEAVTVDHRPLGSPTSSSSSRHHPDQPSHLQHHQLCSELLQQQERHEKYFMQQARQWYLQSPTTSATSTSAVDPNVAHLVNGRSPGVPPPVFRHEATGPLVDIASGGGPQCHWPPPPTYSGLAAPATQRQPSDLHQKELSPTQKSADGGVPFYPWMAVVGRYTLHAVRHSVLKSLFTMINQSSPIFSAREQVLSQ